MNDNTESKSLFDVGDFAQNTIHGYIGFLYNGWLGTHTKNIAWDILIVKTLEDWASDFIKVGTLRTELESELVKVPTSLFLISKAKEYLERLNSSNIFDNLTYVEILQKLNEQEKVLKNEKSL